MYDSIYKFIVHEFALSRINLCDSVLELVGQTVINIRGMPLEYIKMIADDEFYFVALCMMDEGEEVVFPVRFQTRDYKTAVLFTSMLTDRDPEKRIFVCNDVGDIYKVSDKKRA